MKTKKECSKLQEKTVADALDWRVTAGSGARPLFPGDIYGENWLGECKTHTEPGHKLLFNWKVWDKICEEASSARKFPVLVVDDGSQRLDRTWCMYLMVFDTTIPVVDSDMSVDKANISFKLGDLADNTIYRIVRGNQRLGISSFSVFQELVS